MKKILYIGLEFHKKTLSTKFFIDILAKHYEIDFIWCGQFEASLDVMNSPLIHSEYDAVILFQIMLTKEKLQFFKCQNIILIPMYDNDLNITYGKWRQFAKYKFINFSKTLYDKFSFLGVTDNLYVQYAPDVDDSIPSAVSTKAKLFFWQRGNAINFELIKKLLDLDQIESIHLHRLNDNVQKDIFFKPPSKEEIEKYNITRTSWFEDKEDIKRVMQGCDIFIAPRLYEGIGQAFLEAMSYGKCVISPDHPTMNEYIVDGVDGLLFDYHDPKRIDISDFKLLGSNAKKKIRQIHENFVSQENEIISFIQQPMTDLDERKLLSENIRELKKSLQPSNYFVAEDLKMGYYNNNLSMLFSKYLNVLHQRLKNADTKFVIYGAGTGASLLLSIESKKCEYIVDRDHSKHNTCLNDIKIFSLDKLREEKEPKDVLVSVFGRAIAIIRELKGDESLSRHNFISLDIDPFYGELIE
ncbi:glycosyltransferase [Sulfurimonas sp. HSL-1716]|uniref:glycosyltransferase n=1 Tax=Hydrocurvibacter sulfurireducens TaxID=3131937 RepID=UPI0031FA2D72